MLEGWKLEITHVYDHVASACVCCGNVQLKRSPAVLMPFISHRVYQWEPIQIDKSWGLKTIQKGQAYALCNSLLCTQCGLLFLDIRFGQLEMERLYKNYRDESYVRLREHYEPGYRERNEDLLKGISYLQEIESFLQPHLPDKLRVLDWGGDVGTNTPFKYSDACDIFIYDISGIETNGSFKKVSKITASNYRYDLIVCSNVLEHVPFPEQVLREIKLMMTSSTVLYIEVPFEKHVKESIDGNSLLEGKKHWHEHINFFTQKALFTLVSSVGLSTLSFQIIFEEEPHSIFMLACSL